MNLMRMCYKSKEEVERIAKQLGGSWVADHILATSFLGPAPVSVQSIASLLLGASVSKVASLTEWSKSDPLVNRDASWINNRDNAFGFIAKREMASETSIRFAERVQPGVIWPEQTEYKVFNYLTPLTLCEESALVTLLLRHTNHTFLLQIVRRLRAGFLSGRMRFESMLKAAEELSNKRLIATIKLAKRGPKNKRFKPRALVAGEAVRGYYDRYKLSSLPRTPDGHFAPFATVKYHNTSLGIVDLTNGDCTNYRLDGTLNDVWQLVP